MDCCQGNSYCPDDCTSYQRGVATEVEAAWGKAQDKEAIQSDEADDEGRHLTGHERQKASDLTDRTFLPLVAIPEVFPTVDLISHPYNCQVDPHEEVCNGQIGDKDIEATETYAVVAEVKSGHKAAHVAHNGQ